MLFSISAIFLVSFWVPLLYPIAWLIVLALCLIFLLDVVALYKGSGITANRLLPDKFSNSDENPVSVTLKNNYKFKIDVAVVDELPIQFQKRDFNKNITVQPLSLIHI